MSEIKQYYNSTVDIAPRAPFPSIPSEAPYFADHTDHVDQNRKISELQIIMSEIKQQYYPSTLDIAPRAPSPSIMSEAPYFADQNRKIAELQKENDEFKARLKQQEQKNKELQNQIN